MLNIYSQYIYFIHVILTSIDVWEKVNKISLNKNHLHIFSSTFINPGSGFFFIKVAIARAPSSFLSSIAIDKYLYQLINAIVIVVI